VYQIENSRHGHEGSIWSVPADGSGTPALFMPMRCRRRWCDERARLFGSGPLEGLALTFTFHGLEGVVRGAAVSTANFTRMGIAWPEVTGPAIAAFELVAGLALLAGILTRVVAALVTVEMAVALAAVEIPAAALAMLGPGRWSVDAWWR